MLLLYFSFFPQDFAYNCAPIFAISHQGVKLFDAIVLNFGLTKRDVLDMISFSSYIQ
jgi:hypothetical protein